LPVKINYPENILDTCIFTLPSWSTTTTSYKDTLINSDFGTYSIQTSHQKDRMEIIKKLVIYAGDYALDKYPEFFNFYNELKMLENTNTLILSNNQKP
jgi:hypothetical protein